MYMFLYGRYQCTYVWRSGWVSFSTLPDLHRRFLGFLLLSSFLPKDLWPYAFKPRLPHRRGKNSSLSRPVSLGQQARLLYHTSLVSILICRMWIEKFIQACSTTIPNKNICTLHGFESFASFSKVLFESHCLLQLREATGRSHRAIVCVATKKVCQQLETICDRYQKGFMDMIPRYQIHTKITSLHLYVSTNLN